MNKILITGAAGFIGFHLTKSLLDDGYMVLGVDNINDYYDKNLKNDRLKILRSSENFIFHKLDISNRKLVYNAFDSFKPSKVVNLAAQAGVKYSIENPYAYMSSNLSGFLNIIELCREFNVNGLIYASSSSVYGNNSKIPFSVEDRADSPISFYGATKRANELIAYSYSSLYKLHTTGLRYFTVYGPWGRPDMAPFIFTKKVIEGLKIPFFNNGNIKRDFTYIDDVIDGTRAALDKNCKCEIFNLGKNKSEKLEDIISIIENEVSMKAIIDCYPLAIGDIPETCADIEYSKKTIGYQPKVGLSRGMHNFIKWYRDYYNV